MKTPVIVAASVVGLLIVYAFVVFGREMYIQTTQLPRVEEEIGANLDTPTIDGREVIQFSDVKEDGVAYRAGVREGDVLKITSLGLFAKGHLEEGPFSFTVLRSGKEVPITFE